MEWPAALRINAWTGDDGDTSGDLADAARRKVRRGSIREPSTVLRSTYDPSDWKDSRVGWGVVLSDGDHLTKEQRVSGADAPGPLYDLIKERSAPVFRYVPTWPDSHRLTHLRDYRIDEPVPIDGGVKGGTAPGCLPRYLLVYGSPTEIPWSLQYQLQAARYTGRLTIGGDALSNYIAALRNDWQDAKADPHNTIVWAVVHNQDVMTNLMRNAVAAEVYSALLSDDALKPQALFIDGTKEVATGARLTAELAARQPGLIVTTSHGLTGPTTNATLMAERLGMPVDQKGQALSAETLLATWQPEGAIWYAHACCSAGSDGASMFAPLFAPTSGLTKTLNGIAGLGARVAPLPEALLGAKRPLRAFIGHVEPTFDWTLAQKDGAIHLTQGIRLGLYDNLFKPAPLGLSFWDYYVRLGSLYNGYDAAKRASNAGEDKDGLLLALLLSARDVESTVILGDPTVMLPPADVLPAPGPG